MRTLIGTGIISTMRSTRTWGCRLGVGWSRVRVSGSSNSASRAWGCAGVRTALTICYISGSLGSMARLRRCFRYNSNHPPTRNYARPRLVCGQKLWVTGGRLPSGEYLIIVSNYFSETVMDDYKRRWEIEIYKLHYGSR